MLLCIDVCQFLLVVKNTYGHIHKNYIKYVQYRPRVWTHLLHHCVSFTVMAVYIVDSEVCSQ